MTNNEKIDFVLQQVREGRPVLIADATDRENESDWVVSAHKITKEQIAFCMREVCGVFCVTAAQSYFNRVGIPKSPSNNRDLLATPFTLTFDAVDGITTGVSAEDKLKTIEVLLNPESTPNDMAFAGHVNGLIPRQGLFKERFGHSEAGVLICLLAGLPPAAVIAELVNKEDGSMARMDDAEAFGLKFGMELVTTDELLQYCKDNNIWPEAV
jgi:3,4-dihydroxy-2-butanone 4-phosphate synthase